MPDFPDNAGLDVAVVANLNSVAAPGDYNADGVVDARDYAVWRDNLGAPAGTLPNGRDGGPIGAAQYATWRANYGASAATAEVDNAAVPEPVGVLFMLMGMATSSMARRRT